MAFHNTRDQHHQAACEILERYFGQAMVTSDYIFDESLTLALARGGQVHARNVGRSLLEGDIRIIKIGEDLFSKAWRFFEKYEVFSFTDCTSLAVCNQFGIHHLATFNAQFKRQREIEVVDN